MNNVTHHGQTVNQGWINSLDYACMHYNLNFQHSNSNYENKDDYYGSMAINLAFIDIAKSTALI